MAKTKGSNNTTVKTMNFPQSRISSAVVIEGILVTYQLPFEAITSVQIFSVRVNHMLFFLYIEETIEAYHLRKYLNLFKAGKINCAK